ncbi:MAG: hypothetical protein ABSF62_09810 [Bryobacteraceae bacterium]
MVIVDKSTQDKITEAGHQFAWGNSQAAAREHEAAQQCGRTMLWVTKSPEGTTAGQVNPLIVLIAIDPACLPGARFPTSRDDGDGIKQLAQQVLHSFAGTPFVPKGPSSVRAFTIQDHLIIDISTNSTVRTPGGKQPLDVFASLVFTTAKDYWIAWGLMSATQAQMEELKNGPVTFRSPM